MHRISKAVVLIVTTLLLMPTFTATAASIQQGGMGKVTRAMTLSGEIDQSTDVDLATAYKSLNSGRPEQCINPTLLLDSNGGDVGAAIR